MNSHTNLVAGDTLSTTRCYCASPNWETDRKFGYYYHFQYYNIHLDRNYTIELTCNSDKVDDIRKEDDVNHCLRWERRVSDCRSDHEHNTFCYKIIRDYWDEIFFNHQWRKVATYPDTAATDEVVIETCEERCKTQVGGMDMLRGGALESITSAVNMGYMVRWSRVWKYTEIDDMCDGCA